LKWCRLKEKDMRLYYYVIDPKIGGRKVMTAKVNIKSTSQHEWMLNRTSSVLRKNIYIIVNVLRDGVFNIIRMRL